MQKIIASAFLFLSLAGAALAAEKEHRPFSEMKGNCSKFATELKKEFAAWKLPAHEVESSENLPTGKKLRISLAAAGKELFSATLPFAPVENGTYRVALGEKLWVDLKNAETNSVVEASRFEMQTKCGSIFKVVEFPLKKGVKYSISLAKSKKPQQEMLLTIVTK